MNSFGTKLKLTTFGESHGQIIGGVLDGLPAGFAISFNEIQCWIDRRRPSALFGGTQRNETDNVQFISGLLDGITTGAPLAFIVTNDNVKTADYKQFENINRPSHADYVYREKYGIYDFRGGGRASARETLIRVIAGSIAAQMLHSKNIEFQTWVKQIGDIITPVDAHAWLSQENYELFPDYDTKKLIVSYLDELKQINDSIGGVVTCNIKGVTVGMGAPLYDKLNSRLAAAMFSINAVKGFEIGEGFHSAQMKGSAYNDQPIMVGDKIEFPTNHDGGIQAGVSNGNLISFAVAFKPPASIGVEQSALNTEGKIDKIAIHGRHDSCIVPRATVVVEAMAALVILDFYLQAKTDQWKSI